MPPYPDRRQGYAGHKDGWIRVIGRHARLIYLWMDAWRGLVLRLSFTRWRRPGPHRFAGPELRRLPGPRLPRPSTGWRPASLTAASARFRGNENAVDVATGLYRRRRALCQRQLGMSLQLGQAAVVSRCQAESPRPEESIMSRCR